MYKIEDKMMIDDPEIVPEEMDRVMHIRSFDIAPLCSGTGA